jgi:serine protease AprX
VIDVTPRLGAHPLPTPVRVRADPRFRGKGITIALVDAAFHPHPDLVRPTNRIRVWVDASEERIDVRRYGCEDVPVWPMLPAHARGAEWHGLMTSTTAAGNGWLSHGRFRAVASESDVVLVAVSNNGHITSAAIARALRWLRAHAAVLGLRVVSLSVGGDDEAPGDTCEIDDEVEALAADGVVVVAAAGNDGIRRLLPPATSIDAITVGGVDDHNALDPAIWEVWHSNYGNTRMRAAKPEVLAPSLGTIAPLLPGSAEAIEARELFRRSTTTDRSIAERIAVRRLVAADYHLVEGTSVAAPIVASIAACMLEAAPALTPERIKELLMMTATHLRDADDERQGAGAVHAARAVAAALLETVGEAKDPEQTRGSPRRRPHAREQLPELDTLSQPIEFGLHRQEHQPA